MDAGPRATALVVLLALGVFGGLARRQYESLSPLQRTWFPMFLRSSLAAAVRLDPLAYTLKGQTAPRDNAAVRDYLAGTIYDGHSLWWLFLESLSVGGALLLLVIPALRADRRRGTARRQGRYIKGARLVDATAFNRAVRPRRWQRGFRRDAAGMRLRQHGAPTLILPRAIEHSHTLMVGDTGVGKSTLIHAHCEAAERRGETCVIYDADGEYAQTWYRPDRGDVILNPGDLRTAAWDSADEIRDPLEALSLATSMIPRNAVETNPFFTNSARTVFAYLLTLKQSPQQLVEWLTDSRRLMDLLRGTTIQDVVPIDAAQQRSGVMAPLNMVAVTLALCPTIAECGGHTWSAASWAESRTGWVFISGTPTTREQLRPLHTLWFDAIILRVMARRGPHTKLIFDEVASLQKLWQLHTALAEGRKHHLSVVLGFQGYAQLEEIYGRQAETMLSQPAAKYVLRVADATSAERAAKTIGSAEMERIEESRQEGWRRSGASFSLRRAPELLFMDSEIQGLADLRGILKVRNVVTTLQIPRVHRPSRAPALVPRPPRQPPTMPAPPPDPAPRDQDREPSVAQRLE